MRLIEDGVPDTRFNLSANHSMGDFTGVVVFEADNEAAIFQWLLNWNDLVDVEYKPVVEDDEAVRIGKAFLGK